MVRVIADLAADRSDTGAAPAAPTTLAPSPQDGHDGDPPTFDSGLETDRRGHLRDRIGVVSVIAFAVVQLVEVWRSQPVKNLGDVALIEMETRRVFSAEPPLLGAYSRYGWRHPGGALFWIWSPIYEVFGESALALSTAAACLAAFSLWWLLHRTTTDRGFAVTLGVAGLATIATMGNRGAAYAWNINATVLPVLVVVAGCAVALTARRPSVPALLTSAWWCFVFETHAGTGVVLAPALGLTLASTAARRIRGRWEPATHRSFWLAAWTVALVAAPTVLDTVLHRGGNLRPLVFWSITNREPSAGIATALKMVGRATSLSFLSSPEQPHFVLEVAIRAGVLPGLALVVAAVALWRAMNGGHDVAAAALAILGVTWFAAVVSIASIPAPVYFWLVAWMQPLAWMTWAVAIWALMISSQSAIVRSSDISARVGPFAAVILAASAGAAAALGSGAPSKSTDHSAVQVAELADGAELVATGDRVVLRIDAETFDGEVMAAGLLNELDRRKVAVCAGPTWEYRVSSRWKCRSTDAVRTVVVRAEEVGLEAPPGARRVATSDYLGTEDRRRVDTARAIVLDFLAAEGRSDLEPLVDSDFVAAIDSDPALAIRDPAVADALKTLRWAATFEAERYILFA